jgi:hypothetical protein
MLKKALFLSLLVSCFNLNVKAEESSKLEKKVDALEEQIDISDSKIEILTNNVESLNKNSNFKIFGSLALRNCAMSTNVLSEPQNIFKNSVGNILQTRLVAGITGDFIEDFNYQLRVLTNENNSFNMSWIPAGSNLIRLPFNLDRYFITYKPSRLNDLNNSLKFTFGKANNFLPENELLFDEDISFTGLSQQYSFSQANSLLKNVFVGLTENVLTSDGPFNNAFAVGGKVSVKLEPQKDLLLNVGSTYLAYPGANKTAVNQFTQGYQYNTLRNRVDASGNFSSNFNLLDVFGKLSFRLNDLPIELQGNIINNFGALDKNKGFLAGFSIGKTQKTGDISFSYNFKYLEQDYNLSYLVQDQMGGTDVKGNQMDLEFQVAEKTKVFFTLQDRYSISDSKASTLYIIYSSIRQDF